MTLWFSGGKCFITKKLSERSVRNNNGAKTPKYQVNDTFAPKLYGVITAPNPISWIQFTLYNIKSKKANSSHWIS